MQINIIQYKPIHKNMHIFFYSSQKVLEISLDSLQFTLACQLNNIVDYIFVI